MEIINISYNPKEFKNCGAIWAKIKIENKIFKFYEYVENGFIDNSDYNAWWGGFNDDLAKVLNIKCMMYLYKTLQNKLYKGIN